MFNTAITTPISLFLALTAMTGVTLHDTKVDKLATALVGVPFIVAANADGSMKSIASDPHTHAEHVSVKDVKSTQPRIMPRSEQRKHLMQKNMPRGANSYDGYTLPVA
ncbi:MAG: hypothetical protein WBK76_00335 [Candidatus Saccharimonadales bacterium]|jgi:hypothetical protein|nr:hypothetical protein [Patescibacteria group bacterium]